MNTFFIEALHQYGYAALWLTVFVAAVGAPISGTLVLFAAGAFASFGDFNIFILFPIALSAAVMGDNLGYFIGRRVGIPLLGWFERQRRLRFITPQNLERGRAYVRRNTAWAIFITRFLIVVLGGPINFLAGVEQYSYPRFLLWEGSGQVLGAIIPLGLGYAFAASWEEVESIFGAFSILFLVFAVAIVLIVLLLRKIRQDRRASQVHIETTGAIEVNEPVGLNGTSKADEVNELLPLQQLNSQAKQNSGSLPIPD